jgi:hypothetical protein
VYTLDTICDAMAPRFCAARADCCRAYSIPYDDVSCIAAERVTCEGIVNAIGAGRAELVPEYVDGCFEEVERFYQRCVIPYDEVFFELFDLSHICGQAFRGTRAVGETCTSSIDCRVGDDEVLDCDDMTKVCVATRARDEGESCDDSRDVCKPGWYCGSDPEQTMAPPSCRPTLPVGAACDPEVQPSPCGRQLYCDAQDGCRDRLWGTQTCESNGECQSLACESNMCASPTPVVTLEQCAG